MELTIKFDRDVGGSLNFKDENGECTLKFQTDSESDVTRYTNNIVSAFARLVIDTNKKIREMGVK